VTKTKTLVCAIFVTCALLSSCASQKLEPAPLIVSEVNQSSAESAETSLVEQANWETAPVIPAELSQEAREIYALGQQMGRDPNVFSKVGDCGGMPSWFLGPFDSESDEYRLGAYQYLQDVIDHFRGSYGRASLAVRDGFNAAAILSPIRADHEVCNEGEDPLACEYRINNPSISLIMLGTNDVYHVDQFESRLRQIIDYTIDQGILPVLASKPDNLEGDQSINQIIYSLAVEYQIPYWNVWRELQDLPDKGLQEDMAHVTFAPNYFDNKVNMQSGWPHRNLTALQVLDFLWRELVEAQAVNLD
jgi:hypothetical protein